MRTFIHRDFASYNADGSVKYTEGDIQITITKNNYIQVLISGLHDSGNGEQACMLIQYSSKLDLYDTIKKILNKICSDLYCDNNYKDFIINYDLSNITEIWNIDKEIRTNYGGNVWLPFTRENVKYITIEEPCENYYKSINNGYEDGGIVIRGEVFENGDFTYDFPIIGSCDTIETYKESRENMDYYYDTFSDSESN